MGRKKHQPSDDFGQRLGRLRKTRGLTQAQLAKATGVTQANISYYENGARDPTASALTLLAKALGVSADVLLGVKPGKPAAGDEIDASTRRLWRKLQRVQQLPDKERRTVLLLIDSLVEKATLKRAQG